MTAAHVNQHQRIILPVGDIGGIWLPQTLAAPVHAALHQRGWSTPTLAVPPSHNLVVLTDGAAPLQGDALWREQHARLYRLGVKPAGHGSTIALPTMRDHTEGCGANHGSECRCVSAVAWIDEPDGAIRRPFHEVVALVLEVTAKPLPGGVRRG